MYYYQMDAMLGIIYPAHCPVCGQILLDPMRGNRARASHNNFFHASQQMIENMKCRPPEISDLICKPCFLRLPFILEPYCMICGRQLENPLSERCDDCKRYPHFFTETRAVFSYKGVVQQSLYQLKYRGRKEYARFFAAAMACYLSPWIQTRRVTAIVPVPLHKSRYKQRTYNQAKEIAVRLGEYLNIPVYSDLLIRTKKTIAQKELSRSQRIQNLTDAFQIHPKYRIGNRLEMRLQQECILLVDDIYTTGSTVDAAASVLLSAGCPRVFVGAVAVTG